jgi:adenylate cyclase
MRGCLLYNCGCLYSRLGEVQRAIEMLEQAVTRGFSDIGWMRHDADLTALRGNAEFVALTAAAPGPPA